MSYLPQEVRDAAEALLTEKQLEAWNLEQAGWGLNRIARHLHITKGAVYARIEGAHLKMWKAGIRQDEFGRWTVKEAA